MANMLTPLALGLLLVMVNCHPVNEEENQNIELNISTEDDSNIRNLEIIKKALENSTYIQKFKTMMAEYVKKRHINLTEHEMDTIKGYFEEFCHEFSMDLKTIIENGQVFKETIDDDIPDSMFENIKESIKSHLPGTKHATLDNVAYLWRKNMFLTQQKIEKAVTTLKSQI